MIWSMMRRGGVSPVAAATQEPLQVVGLTATASGQTTINLSWTSDSTPSPNGATSYVVERSVDGLGSWSTIGTVTVPTTTFSDTSLSASQTRYYRVSAYNSFGGGLPSATANATTAVAAPSAPSGLTATATSSTQINLAWTDNANNETGFKVERSTDNTNWTEIVGNLAANSTSYSATGLTASTLYYFRVRAYNAGGNSAYTSSASATTQSGSSTYSIEYLTVAGGGGGGTGGGGGGGAGGSRTASGYTLTVGSSYTVTVGAGGASATSGSNSVFDTITSDGGGRGGTVNVAGTNGGSGGGGGADGAATRSGGTGTSGQGNDGGTNGDTANRGYPHPSGGGGGAGGTGANGSNSNQGGAGGAGSASSITGTSVTRAGGGGGGVYQNNSSTGGAGGSGGGGVGSNGTTNAGSGTVNSGSGGGGGGLTGTAGSGGSGIVILRVPAANYSGTTTGSPTVTDDGSTKVLTFTASGSYTG